MSSLGKRAPQTPSGDRLLEQSSPTAETTITIQPDQGGWVTAGRYTVFVPPGALRKATAITVRSWDRDEVLECELLPHGLTFRSPVSLWAWVGDTQLSQGSGQTIYWWDDSNKKWEDQLGTFNLFDVAIVAQLSHFSVYRPGRAGW